MQIAILAFDRLTALDAVGPYEVLRGIPDSELHFVAREPGPKPTDHGALALVATHPIADVPSPDVIVVPGGPGEASARREPEVLEWLRAADATSQWTTSVCTGSLLLGAAGLLEGRRATSHWTALETLREFGAEPVADERVVFDGKVVTAAGVSSGIDMALALAGRLAGVEVAQGIQLAIEYDPQPPFDAGSTSKAPPEIVDFLRRSSRFWAT
jgi:transcriptional regulator GlxA family with amidase domain